MPIPVILSSVFLGLLLIILGLLSHSILFVCCGIAPILLALTAFTPNLIYWELDASCLRQQRFWKKKEIAWIEVRLVRKSSYYLDSFAIYFGHQIADYGFFVVNSANREQFISAIRQFAPQADFDV